ncbi:MAG: GDP-mannose 4,6-dehydratase [Polyangiaceae bacterium]
MGRASSCPSARIRNLVLGPSIKGRWSYAASKLIDEFLTLAYWKEKRLPTTVVRLFNTVGPRQTGQYGMVIPNFVKQALANEPISVFGDGHQSRCFCHVRDVIGALERLCRTDKSIGEVFNIGSYEEVTILQLAERVKLLTGSSSPIELVPYEKAYEEGFEDMFRRVPDIAKVNACVGFQPTAKLDEILKDVIAFHRNETASRSRPPRDGATTQ